MMVNCGQEALREYLVSKYDYTKGNWDIYIAFFERGLKLANVLSFITPDKWLTKPFGKELRTHSLPFLSILLQSGRDVFESVGVDSIVTVFARYKESPTFEFQQFTNSEVSGVHIIPKNVIEDPYQLDIVFSPYLDLILSLTKEFNPFSQYGFSCENACATSDAYELKEILSSVKESSSDKHYRVINTGTIDKYCSRWGKKEMTYLKGKYLHPVVEKSVFNKRFPNTYSAKSRKSKLIIKGLTLLDATLDLYGEYVPGKTTLIVTAKESEDLHFASLVINSKVAQFYITERYSSASYNGGVNFTKDMLKNLPVPPCNSDIYKVLTGYLKHSRYLDLASYPFFEELGNALIYELYFERQFKAKGLSILSSFPELHAIQDDWETDKLIKAVEKAFRACSESSNLLSSLSRIKEVEEVRLIEERP